MKRVSLILVFFGLLLGVATCFAAGPGEISGIKTVANTVRGNLAAIVQLLTGVAFVAGIAFAIGGIVKFKAHKDNPTQVHISNAIVLLFIGAALIFLPGVFLASGTTMFGAQGKISSTSGFYTISGAGKIEKN